MGFVGNDNLIIFFLSLFYLGDRLLIAVLPKLGKEIILLDKVLIEVINKVKGAKKDYPGNERPFD